MRTRLCLAAFACLAVSACGASDEPAAEDTPSPAEAPPSSSAQDPASSTESISADPAVSSEEYLTRISATCSIAYLRAEIARRKARRAAGGDSLRAREYFDTLKVVYGKEVARIRATPAAEDLIDEAEAYVGAQEDVIHAVSRIKRSIVDGNFNPPGSNYLLKEWKQAEKAAVVTREGLTLDCPDLGLEDPSA